MVAVALPTADGTALRVDVAVGTGADDVTGAYIAVAGSLCGQVLTTGGPLRDSWTREGPGRSTTREGPGRSTGEATRTRSRGQSRFPQRGHGASPAMIDGSTRDCWRQTRHRLGSPSQVLDETKVDTVAPPELSDHSGGPTARQRFQAEPAQAARRRSAARQRPVAEGPGIGPCATDTTHFEPDGDAPASCRIVARTRLSSHRGFGPPVRASQTSNQTR